MASIYDKLAQAKYEEKLKATIISKLKGVLRYFTSNVPTALARSVYSHYKPADITFDVTTGFDYDLDSGEKAGMLAWLISYTKTDEDIMNWDALLQSKQGSSIEDTYQSLIQVLRVKMADLIG